MVGAITLVGCLMGSLILLPLADYQGRRPMNILFLTTQTFAMFIFISAFVQYESYLLLCFACFVAGSVSIPLVGVMLCYVSELSTLDMMYFFTGVSFFAEAITSIIVGVYFKFYKDCAVFYLIVTVLLLLFLLMYVWLAKESPHFLFK